MKQLSITLMVSALMLSSGCGATPTEAQAPLEGEGGMSEATAIPEAASESSHDPDAVLLEGVESFDLGGLQVIVKQVPGNPVVSTGLYFRGGVYNLSPETAGIEDLAMTLVAEGGSTQLSRTEVLSQLDSMGSVIGAYAGRHYSIVGLRSVREHWEASFALFAQVVLHPSFPEDELERSRARSIQMLEGLKDSADTYVNILAQDLLFAGHPYALRQWGTVENLQRFTRQDLVDYYQGLLSRERLLLVVVGDLSADEVRQAMLEPFAEIPLGSWRQPAIAPLPEHEEDSAIYSVEGLPTSYVFALFRAPAPGDPDYYPMVVATSILSERLFEKIRTKLKLSYAVAAGVADLPANYGYLYLSSSSPDEAFEEVLDEVEAMQDWLVNADNLEEQVAMTLTQTYTELEGMAGLRNLLAEAQILRGDWRQAAGFITGMRSVSPKAVRRVMQQWVKDLQIGRYGDFPASLPEPPEELEAEVEVEGQP